MALLLVGFSGLFGGSVAAASPALSIAPTRARVPAAVATSSLLERVRRRALSWSRHPRWHALEARNLGEAPFRAEGAAPLPGPATRLIAFAQVALSPPSGTAADDHAACRQPVRWRVLRSLAAADGVGLPARPTCTALTRFTDTSRTTELEVLFVTPSSTRAAASFGHLLLRLSRHDEPEDSAEHNDVVYEISALTGFAHTGLGYLAGGLGGSFPLVFERQPLNAVLADNLHGQQRSIRRFRLNLTDAQRRQVLELLWQVERELALPYRFLNRNCATYLLWLLATALDGAPTIDPSVGFYASPAEIVDRMARVEMAHDHQPLLSPAPGSFESSSERRQRAIAVISQSLSALRNLPAPLGAQWRRWRPTASTAAQHTLIEQTLRRHAGMARQVHRLLLGRVLATRAQVDETKARADKIDHKRIQPIPGVPLPTIATTMRWRRNYFRHEAPEWRRAQQVKRLLWIDRYVRRAPRRPATASERAHLASARQAQAAFVRATDVYANAVVLLPNADTDDLGRDWDHALRALEAARWGQRVVKGPAGLVGLGVRGLNAAGASPSWAVALSTAFWREELGQWRPHGLGPLTKFVLADVHTFVGVDRAGVRWLGNEATLFELARMTTQPRVAGLRWLSRVGWGVAVRSHLSPGAAGAQARLDGYLLLADGVETAWTAGLRIGAMPSVTLRPERLVDIAAVAEPFVQRRLGATGRVAGLVRFQRAIRGQRFAAELSLLLPWGAREAWWTTARLHQTCDAAWRCQLGWSGGLMW